MPPTRPRREFGGAIVELSMSIMFFVWLCIIICDLIQYSYRTVSAQYLVSEFMRTVSRGGFEDVSAIENALIQQARTSGIKLTSNNIRICALESSDPDAPCDFEGNKNIGAGRDLISISVKFDFPFRSWGGSYPVEADAIGRNEPF